MAGGGRIRPRLFFAMGDVLSTHLDDARRQHITGESRAAQRAPGAQLRAPGLRHHPGPLFTLWLGPRRVRPRAGREWPGTKSIVQACFLHVRAPLPNLF